jgi:uncharacterized membrane protein
MNPRVPQLGAWSVTTLAIALLVHFGTLYALPRLVMRRALRKMGEPNSMHFGRVPTAASRMVVRPSPDILYASCPFDLSSGPLRVTANVSHTTYWSVSAFDAATNNFFVRNDREVTGDSIELLLVRRRQTLPLSDHAPEHVIVFAPSRRGLLLFRTVIDDDRHLSALEALQRQGRCETVRADPEAHRSGQVSPRQMRRAVWWRSPPARFKAAVPDHFE